MEDKYYRNHLTNTFKNGDEEFIISKTNFMPTIGIEFLNKNVEDNLQYLIKKGIDILEDD